MIWFFLLLLVIFCLIIFKYIKSNILLPKHTVALIDEVISQPKLTVMFNELQYVKLKNTTICYEHIASKNPNAEVILLLHGLGQSMLNFPPYFCQLLLDAGFQIVRIDQQDCGGSHWVENWGQPHKYTLEDMASHNIQVMDHLNINKFHLVGISMGGMIAQSMAIGYTNRVSSLTSIMSSAYFFDPKFGGIPKPFLLKIVLIFLVYGRRPKTVKGKIKVRLAIKQLLQYGNTTVYDDSTLIAAANYEITKKKGYNPKASKQQSYAIKKSGSRIGALKKLNIPALVIHGVEDPLIKFAHAKKCVAAIPNCKFLLIDEMGHHLSKKFNNEIAAAIKNLILVKGED